MDRQKTAENRFRCARVAFSALVAVGVLACGASEREEEWCHWEPRGCWGYQDCGGDGELDSLYVYSSDGKSVTCVRYGFAREESASFDTATCASSDGDNPWTYALRVCGWSVYISSSSADR